MFQRVVGAGFPSASTSCFPCLPQPPSPLSGGAWNQPGPAGGLSKATTWASDAHVFFSPIFLGPMSIGIDLNSFERKTTEGPPRRRQGLGALVGALHFVRRASRRRASSIVAFCMVLRGCWGCWGCPPLRPILLRPIFRMPKSGPMRARIGQVWLGGGQHERLGRPRGEGQPLLA